MKRLTFECKFCDICACIEIPCPYLQDGGCDQRKTWERLKAMEDILGADYDLDSPKDILAAHKAGNFKVMPCKVGDTVFSIRIKGDNNSLHRYGHKKFDFAIGNNLHMIEKYRELCYVGEKKCTKTDFNLLGKSVFLTREEAESFIKEYKTANG